MGNLISNRRAGEFQYVGLSNGITDLVMSALLLAGSRLATSRWERELCAWLAGHDQTQVGLGRVGFDLDDLAWDPEGFPLQREFCFRMIALAVGGFRWIDLPGGMPRGEALAGSLVELRALLEDYRKPFVTPGRRWTWQGGSAPDLSPCPRHKVIRGATGCLLCHLEPISGPVRVTPERPDTASGS
jgi:hypothetical protein